MTENGSEENNTLQLTSVRNQYIAIIIANLLMFANGLITGWPTQFIPIFVSKDTPLASGPLSAAEISWIVSISNIGSLISSICNGLIIPFIGSKRCLLYATIPMILFWLLIHFATNFYWLLIARLISGFTGNSIYIALILFSSEVANDNIRGRLTSFTFLSMNIGYLIAYVLGAFVDYDYIPYICATITIIFCVPFILLPNTPRYHLANGNVQKAENALKFYKRYRGKDQFEDNAIAAELDRLKTVQNEQKTTEKLRLSDLCNRNAMKGIFIGCAMVAITQCTAYFIITNYATLIFTRTDSTLIRPQVSAIILAVALTLGSLLPTYLADFFGRKVLILISLISCVVGLSSLAFYHYLYLNNFDLSSFRWVPTFSLSFVIFIEGVGVVPLSIVCMIETLPTKIRSVGTTIVIFMSNLILFGFLKIFPFLLDSIDVHGCMAMFAILSTLGIIFVATVLKETVGRSLDDIGVKEEAKIEHARARSLSIGS